MIQPYCLTKYRFFSNLQSYIFNRSIISSCCEITEPDSRVYAPKSLGYNYDKVRFYLKDLFLWPKKEKFSSLLLISA